MRNTTKSKERPGTMVYFENWISIIENCDDERTGRIFKAIFKYAYTGEASDGLTGDDMIFFDMLSRSVDNDREKYEKKCADNAIKGKYSQYKAECEVRKEEALAFVLWKKQFFDHDNSQQQPTGVDSSQPIKTSTGISTTTKAETLNSDLNRTLETTKTVISNTKINKKGISEKIGGTGGKEETIKPIKSTADFIDLCYTMSKQTQ